MSALLTVTNALISVKINMAAIFVTVMKVMS